MREGGRKGEREGRREKERKRKKETIPVVTHVLGARDPLVMLYICMH